MKVEIDSAALADAVAWTTRVIDARPANPILAGIRLEAIDGTLQLSAFNYEISARHHIEAGIDEPGTALVLGKLLADITKSLPAEKTYLSTDASPLTISSGKSTFPLQLMPDTEYPDLPIVPAKIGQVDAPTFVQAVSQASVAVSREENRPVLTGVRIQFEGDKVVMTSTDRFRLSRSSFSWTPQDRDLSTTTLVRGSLLRDVARQKTPYTFLPDSTATAARHAFQKGIGCILACQVKQNGQPSVWCAQHDRRTLAPCKARAYELPSLSGAESVNITLLLMSLPQPDSTVVQAVEGAVAWFRKTAITNLKREDFTNAQGEKDYRMVKTADAPRIWARFYEVETNRPFFCGRDGVKKYRVEDIEYERRNGYSWYNRAPEKVLEQYDQWKKRNMRYKKHPGRKT